MSQAQAPQPITRHTQSHTACHRAPRDLIVFGEDWGGLPSSTQHLIRCLATDRQILWINSIGLRQPQWRYRDLQRAARKILSACQRRNNTPSPQAAKVSTPTNVTVLHPLTVPAPASKAARVVAAGLLRAQIMPWVKRLQLHRPILWTSLPTAADLLGTLGDEGCVYYCGDDFSALAGVDHTVVAQHEQRLLQRCQLVLAASEALRARLPDNKTVTLPHGVDVSLFASPQPRARDLPDNGRPTAGFYGSLSSWLDLALLDRVITCLPEWNFVFIGREEVDLSCLKRHPHAHFLGPRPHHSLPTYSQHWQASLLPFVDNAQIRACNPLKLLEYLAAGSDIVSTEFPALAPYRHFIQVANHAEGFIRALQHCDRQGRQNTRVQAMQQAVQPHTWQARAAKASACLESL